MAGMGLGSFLSGAAAGMQAGQRFQDFRDRRAGTPTGDASTGQAIQIAGDNQPLNFSGEGYAPGQRLMESAADAGRQIREEQQRNLENSNAMNTAQPQQAQQGMGIDPSTAMSIYSKFAGSGSASSAGGSESGMGLGSFFGGGSGAASGGAASGGSAAGGSTAGSSSIGGAAAAAGPWAALAAIIGVNEKSARNGGHRRDGWQYGKDLIGGKVLEQDANGRWAQKLGGYDDDKTGLLNDAGAGAEFTTLDFSNGFKKLKNGTTGKIIDAVKKIF